MCLPYLTSIILSLSSSVLSQLSALLATIFKGISRMAHIVWFRQDLRLQDNPASYHACKMGDILPIYIHDTYNPKNRFYSAKFSVKKLYLLQISLSV